MTLNQPNKLFMILLNLLIVQAAWSIEVVVKKIDINIAGGKTQERAVLRRLEVKELQVYTSEQELRDAVQRDVQELINLRYFLNVRGSAERIPGSETDYQVSYEIEDAFTFTPIPMVLYNSNTGGTQLLYVQVWGNVFGSLMSSFSIMNLTLRDDGTGGVETGPWLFSSILSNIPLGKLNMSVGYAQARVESSRYDGALQLSSYRYDTSALSVKFERRFGASRFFYYTVKPAVELRYGYTDFIGAGGFETSFFRTELFQSIYFNNVDNYFNSRRGWKIGLANTLYLIQRNEQWVPVTDFLAEAGYYMAFGKRGRFSYYPRISIISAVNDVYEELGAPVRGIPDATMDGRFAAYINQTFGISLWQWKNVWDLQIHPWFDLALALGGSREFTGLQDIRTSTGADILLFIEKIPNLVFRFSWGVDLDASQPWGAKNKTEFIVNYSFSY